MNIFNGLPVYNAIIADDCDGIQKISLVENPAVRVDFITLSHQEPIKLYKVENDEQQIIYGVVVLADTPIYRHSPELGQYYIMYSKDIIKTMSEKFILDGNANKINLEHLDNTDVEGVNLLELFIKDKENGINPVGFETVPDGSLFAKYKVHSPILWDAIKQGQFKGFSLEGLFHFDIDNEPIDDETQIWNDILSMLKQIEKK